MTQVTQPCVTSKTTAEGQTFELEANTWPNGPLLRVRDGLRDRNRLPDDVLSERAIVLEVLLEGTGWHEIVVRPYVRHMKEDDGKVPLLLPGAFKKAALRQELVERAGFEILDMAEQAFCW